MRATSNPALTCPYQANNMIRRDKPSGEVQADVGKRPYSRPRVMSRERLEAVAAICSPPGKADPGSCPTGPIGS